jgi:hypothetical protein
MLKPTSFLTIRLLMLCVTPGLDRSNVLFLMIDNIVMGLHIFGTDNRYIWYSHDLLSRETTGMCSDTFVPRFL